jgi:hypothetical protein
MNYPYVYKFANCYKIAKQYFYNLGIFLVFYAENNLIRA